MDNEVRIIYPPTSIDSKQYACIDLVCIMLEMQGFNPRTFNTKGDPCEPRMDFKANQIEVCNPETICNPDCRQLPTCKIQGEENQN